MADEDRLINVHLNSIHCEVNDVLSEEVILRLFSQKVERAARQCGR